MADLAEISLLDLHNNALEKLPEDVGALTKLTVRDHIKNSAKSQNLTYWVRSIIFQLFLVNDTYTGDFMKKVLSTTCLHLG